MFRAKGVVAAFVILSLCAFTAGCGGDDGASEEQLQQAREDGAKEAKAQVKLNQLQRQVNRLAKKNKRDSRKGRQSSSGTSSAAAPAPVSGSSTTSYTECSFGVKAGPNTSCAFAMNVSGEYGSNPGSGTIQAFSPVTGMDYTMQCGPSSGGTICSGGNGASVFIP